MSATRAAAMVATATMTMALSIATAGCGAIGFDVDQAVPEQQVAQLRAQLAVLRGDDDFQRPRAASGWLCG